MSNRNRFRSLLAATCMALTGWGLTACSTVPPQAAGADMSFDQAITSSTDELIAQTRTLPGVLARLQGMIDKKSLIIDPMIDADTGQQTMATARFERLVSLRIAQAYAQLKIVSFQPAELATSDFLLIGTVERESSPGGQPLVKLNLALIEIKTGTTVASSSAVAHNRDIDMSPTAYYRDSPVLVMDRTTLGYIRSAATSAGQQADPDYTRKLSNSAVVNEATRAYDEQRYAVALDKFRAANHDKSDPRLKALNGEYMSHVKLGQIRQAEIAFGKMLAYAIPNDVLQIRFLFAPGSTEFWQDPVTNPYLQYYPMWLRQIAKELALSSVCMTIVGHTSRTGSEALNARLSLQRATAIQQELGKESPQLLGRTEALGMGFQQNLIGSGTDDAGDALDRRVEFKVVPCR
jgi:outer membrane protein OmpA-like peptidoglycan-associated protein